MGCTSIVLTICRKLGNVLASVWCRVSVILYTRVHDLVHVGVNGYGVLESGYGIRTGRIS